MSHGGSQSSAPFPPSNFAATSQPSFLQQDPFAFAGVQSGRQRTQSSGSSHSHSSVWQENAQQQQQQQHFHQQQQQQQSLAALAALAGQTGFPGSQFDGFQNQMNQHPFRNLMQNGSNMNQGGFGSGPANQQHQQQQPSANESDDVIPTAIVVKNIPFSFPSASLLQIMEELGLVPPYAFNYHYDTGVFRGLAFANFHTPQETDACVAAMNGFEIQGRKLRVEYKKVLQAGEKERIERDKAIKRMKSMQIERERLLQQHVYLQQQQQMMGNPYQQGPAGPVADDQWEDYGRAIHPHESILNSVGSAPSSFLPAGFPPQAQSFETATSSGASNSGRSGTGGNYELDMNDGQTLEIYSRVLLFKDDPMRDELAFSRSLTNMQRRTVHLVAQKLGLNHKSVGMGDERHAVVFKSHNSSAQEQQQQRLRNRASAHHLLPSENHTSSPNTMSSFSANTLRKKSMPDLRHQQHHPFSAQSSGIPPVPALPGASNGSSITPRHSHYDLRAANRRSAFNGSADLTNMPDISNISSFFPQSAPNQPLPSAHAFNPLPSTPTASHKPLNLFSPPGFGQLSNDARAVGSPVSTASSAPNGLPNLLRQPKGPDSNSTWGRATTNDGSNEDL
jgi:hypothetical protein